MRTKYILKYILQLVWKAWYSESRHSQAAHNRLFTVHVKRKHFSNLQIHCLFSVPVATIATQKHASQSLINPNILLIQMIKHAHTIE